jgi:3-oxoacyl-[acyl-carrier-protein] synthase II
MMTGKSGLCRSTIDDPALKTTTVGQVKDFDPSQFMPAPEVRRTPRIVHLALAASIEALQAARFSPDPEDIDSQRKMGVALGTGGGGLAFVEDQYRAFFLDGSPSLFSITAGTHGNLSGELSIALRLRGPSHVISTGCTSSTDAIGYAMSLIREGRVPMMLAGGSDAPISQGILHGFEKMRVLSTRKWEDPTRGSRPFSKDRDGFILGEGAWMFVLESLEHALARDATIYAELTGYASTCDAFHRVQIAPDVAEPVRAMQDAIADAGLRPKDIDGLNLHGTGTPMNDRLETVAVKKVFGERAYGLPCSASKSMVGHPQGACGALGIAAAVLGMREGMVHPTINLDEPDPDCDLDYVSGKARSADLRNVLCNCIAFGSKNSAIVVTKFDGS